MITKATITFSGTKQDFNLITNIFSAFQGNKVDALASYLALSAHKACESESTLLGSDVSFCENTGIITITNNEDASLAVESISYLLKEFLSHQSSGMTISFIHCTMNNGELNDIGAIWLSKNEIRELHVDHWLEEQSNF
ncbi:hypothetical protein [Photobacterium leiognathi]|uniref:hypothetical protein n=1 Tax=Photobacterium leiognathi TaxID=553611 RepID=UPI0029818C68|nr:hypothetical protein [Photobacterium leiognathi]